MDSTDPTAVIILSEIVFFETVVIIGFAVLFFLNKRKTVSRLKKILGDYKASLPERKATLISTYSDGQNKERNDTEKLIDNIIEHETTFFHTVIDTTYKSKSAIQDIPKEIHTLVSPYAQLLAAKNAAPEETTPDDSIVPDIDSAIDDLLADEADDAEGDPALDLSENLEEQADSEEETSDEIEEIPKELLSDTDTNESIDSDQNKDDIESNSDKQN